MTEHELPAALYRTISELPGAGPTTTQWATITAAYHHDPSGTERAIASAENADRPVAYLVSSSIRIRNDDGRPRPASSRKRTTPNCARCDSTGWVDTPPPPGAVAHEQPWVTACPACSR